MHALEKVSWAPAVRTEITVAVANAGGIYPCGFKR